jgi:hypothetical protein
MSYQLAPLGVSMYPAPSVGYSRVEVASIPENNLGNSRAGKTVSEFYTAKDFPIKARATGLTAIRKRSIPGSSLFTLNNADRMTVSQGFSVVLNNMHGQKKGEYIYAADSEDPISSKEYIYQTENGYLDNKIDVINKDGSVQSNLTAGVSYDYYTDMREHESVTYTPSVEANGASFLAGFIFGFVPTIFPGYSRDYTLFRSATFFKVIHKQGILKEVRATDLGSVVTSKNLAYDKETGQVLLTETVNNFDDPVFSYSIPAYWAYPYMSGAYKNIGLKHTLQVVEGEVDMEYPEKYFYPGDELVSTSVGMPKLWVSEVTPGINGSIAVVDRVNTEDLDLSSAVYRVYRSGNRNIQGLSAGSFTIKDHPIVSDEISINSIIDVGAVEFTTDWKTYCDCPEQLELMELNPYVSGLEGVYRPWRSHAYLTSRNYSSTNNNTNIRTDGTYTDFIPFWSYDNGLDKLVPNYDHWQFVSEVTDYHAKGAEIENRNALDIYSSAFFGFASTLPMAIAQNSRYRESGYDGFEDYAYSSCLDDHFSFREANPSLDITRAHTGFYSLKLLPGDTLEIEKILVPCDEPQPNN